MKLILILTFAIFSWLLPNSANPSVKSLQNYSSIKSDDTVWICNGKYATKYHKTKTCSGLNNCKSTITSIDKADAIEKDRTECDKCY